MGRDRSERPTDAAAERRGADRGHRRGGRLVDDLIQDLRVALRSLRKQPAFALATILTLAVGIGANVALFGVADLALFRALPFRDADQLVVGRTAWPDGTIGWTVSAPDYYDVRDQATSFRAIGAVTPFTRDVTVTGTGEAVRVPLAWASPGFFRTLGATPLLGREFVPEEGEPGRPPVVMVSHAFWQQQLGGRRDVLGATVVLDGTPATVVGVMPRGFAFRTDAQVWAPMVRGEVFATQRQYHNWLVVGRRAPGVSVDEARAEVGVIMARLARTYPESNEGMGMVITPLREAMVEGLRPGLLMLLGASGLLLLIACGNVASLLLARASARSTEVALRSALGAGRSRLVRQLLTEAAVLGLAAGALGTALALVARRALVAATPLASMGIEAPGLQPLVLVFAIALSLATVLVFGLAPALSTIRAGRAGALRAGTRAVAGGRGRFQNALVVAQVALSVVLLVGAGLLVRSFSRLQGVDPGFDARDLLTAEISLPRSAYDDAARRRRFFEDYLGRARAMPGVEAAGLASALPIRDAGGNVGAWDASRPPTDASEVRLAYRRVVAPGYFQAMAIPIRAGRDVRATDDPSAPPVLVINETMAARLFPGEDPLGRIVAVDQGEREGRFEVVGVVGDTRVSGLARAPDMVMYFPFDQQPQYTMRLVVRAAGATALTRPLRSALTELDPDIPLAGVETMDHVLARSVAFTRAIMGVLVAFAGVALFLAALGLYGVLAYFVARRQREIGVRVALGATVRDVAGLVLGRGFGLVALGLVVGTGAALVATRLLSGFLFEVEARDPATFVGVGGFFLAVATVACLIPAWRAWRTDPVGAFRAE